MATRKRLKRPAVVADDAQPVRRTIEPIVYEVRLPDPREAILDNLWNDLLRDLFHPRPLIDISVEEFKAVFSGLRARLLVSEVSEMLTRPKRRTSGVVLEITGGADIHYNKWGDWIACLGGLEGLDSGDGKQRDRTPLFGVYKLHSGIFVTTNRGMVTCDGCRVESAGLDEFSQSEARKQTCISLAARISRIARSIELEPLKETIVMETRPTISLLASAKSAHDIKKLKTALELTHSLDVVRAAALLFCSATDEERKSSPGVKLAASVISLHMGALTDAEREEIWELHAIFTKCADADE